MEKAGRYALGFVLLAGVLMMGAAFITWDAVHPAALKPALVS
jgi:hypothetical protein